GSKRRLQIVTAVLDEGAPYCGTLLRAMPTTELGDDRVLARKILIEGRDVDAGALGDAVRRQTADALAHQNVSCRLKQGLHCRVRAFLPRQFPRRKLGSASHSHPGQKCKLTDISICLHYRA